MPLSSARIATQVRKLVSNLFGVDPRRTVDPMLAVALGAAAHAGMLSGEVAGVRVLQAWQAELGRMLERRRERDADAGAERAADEEEDEEAAEEAAMAAFRQRQSQSGDTLVELRAVEGEEGEEVEEIVLDARGLPPADINALFQRMGRGEAGIIRTVGSGKRVELEDDEDEDDEDADEDEEEEEDEEDDEDDEDDEGDIEDADQEEPAEWTEGVAPKGVDINELFRRMGRGEEGGAIRL